MMSLTVKELREKSDEEVITLHDNLAKNTSEGVDLYLSELARRDQSKQTEAILSYTRWITWMTGIVVLATIVNLTISFICHRF